MGKTLTITDEYMWIQDSGDQYYYYNGSKVSYSHYCMGLRDWYEKELEIKQREIERIQREKLRLEIKVRSYDRQYYRTVGMSEEQEQEFVKNA